MHTIHVDYTKKIITFEVAGILDLDSVKAFTHDLEEALYQFGPKEVSILACMELLDPVAQNCLPYMADSIAKAIAHARKIASVHKRVITRMQMERIEKSVYTGSEDQIRIVRFSTRQQAMRYLLRD